MHWYLRLKRLIRQPLFHPPQYDTTLMLTPHNLITALQHPISHCIHHQTSLHSTTPTSVLPLLATNPRLFTWTKLTHTRSKSYFITWQLSERMAGFHRTRFMGEEWTVSHSHPHRRPTLAHLFKFKLLTK